MVNLITKYALRNTLSPDWPVTTLEPHFAAPIDLDQEVGAALAVPLQSARLSELAKTHARV